MAPSPCKHTASQTFIRNQFRPYCSVICSELAENSCKKNNLNFVELLQPFCKQAVDMYIRDYNGSMLTVQNLQVTFQYVDSKPPQTSLARCYLNASVNDDNTFKTIDWNEDNTANNTYNTNDLATNTPWFEHWTETFFQVQHPSDHEYVQHYLACFIVVSSADEDPVDSVFKYEQKLQQMLNSTPGKLPKFMMANLLKYYVIIHDNVDGDKNKASTSYQTLKETYGDVNCFLLMTNSRSLNENSTQVDPVYSTDPWSQFIQNQLSMKFRKASIDTQIQSSLKNTGNQLLSNEQISSENHVNDHPLSPDIATVNTIADQFDHNHDAAMIINSRNSMTQHHHHGDCLSSEDIEQIKLLIVEFCKGCLLPYVERQIQQLYDFISNKKGVSRSLLSVTKRWLNPTKLGVTTNTQSLPQNNLIYTSDAPELQIRKLADLYFLFGQYNSAYQMYNLAKKEYSADQAWLYYAGALEMAALSVFMSNESNRKMYEYIEESITTYLTTCKVPQFATRATLLGVMCLKSRCMYGEAARQLIRMTSGESDLRSALFLEQTAFCFYQLQMFRKYAFHMVLAGHRYLKATQRMHAIRTYEQAFSVYAHSGWLLAEDHIFYTIGHLAHSLFAHNRALSSIAKLVIGNRIQSYEQQTIYLKEYLTILMDKLKTSDSSSDYQIEFIIPQIDHKQIKVLLGPTQPVTVPGKTIATGITFNDNININDDTDKDADGIWLKLERDLVNLIRSDYQSASFKPITNLCLAQNLCKANTNAVVNEPIQFCISMQNTLKIPIHLRNICLLWTYKQISTSADDASIIQCTNSSCDQSIIENSFVKTHNVDTCTIQSCSEQNVILAITPLSTGLIQILGISYAISQNNDIESKESNVLVRGRQLFHIRDYIGKEHTIELEVFPSTSTLQVSFTEINSLCLCNELRKITIDFRNVSHIPLKNIYMTTSKADLLVNLEQNNNSNDFNATTKLGVNNCIIDSYIIQVPVKNNRMNPEQTFSMDVWLKAPKVGGPCTIDLLIYYENYKSGGKPKYRLVRHLWRLTVLDVISLELTTQTSHNIGKEDEEQNKLNIVMKLTNSNCLEQLNPSVELSIINVGLYSHIWMLSPNVQLNLWQPKCITLNAQQSIEVLLKAERSTSEGEHLYSTVVFNSERPMLHNMHNIYAAFAKKAFSTTDCQQGSVDNGIVLLQWQALLNENNVKRLVNGQCEIPYNQTESNSLRHLSSFQLDKNQLKVFYRIAHPSIIHHDFNTMKLCLIPLKLHLYSIVNDSDVTVIVNALRPSFSSQANIFYTSPSVKNFIWLAHGNQAKLMSPLSSDCVQLVMAVSKPGTYNLSRHLQVLCKNDHYNDDASLLDTKCYALQLNCVQSTLIVVNSPKENV